jgi:hypothetical protein
MKDSDCGHDPRLTLGPIGMYHCPECGEMQVAGFKHTGIMEEKDWDAIEKSSNYKDDNEELF